MTLDGFTYERPGWNSPSDAATRKAWLSRQPQQHLSQKTFRPQPVDQLARVLRAMGQDDQATAIAIYKQQRKTGLFPVPERVRAVLLFVAMVGCVLLADGMIGTALFANLDGTANLLGWMRAAACLLALYLTGGISWLGRTLLGLLAAHGYKPTLIWLEILFGWIASGIILALVTGMLKKD